MTSNANDDEMFKQNFCPSILSTSDYVEDYFVLTVDN